MKETNVSKLGSEIKVTEDNIPGTKVQMNDNFVPSDVPEDFAKQNSNIFLLLAPSFFFFFLSCTELN